MKNKLLLLLCLPAFIFTISCSEADKEEEENSEIQITDATSLSKALEVEGGTRKTGDIPYPGNGEYGGELEVQTTSVIVTPNSEFNFTARAKGEAGILFLKVDGTDEYFEIPYSRDDNDNLRMSSDPKVARRAMKRMATSKETEVNWCRPNPPIRLTAHALIPNTISQEATVQTFEMPMQGAPVDFSNLQLWSPPQKVQIRAVPTGTGNVTITLTWDQDNSDVDLWLEEPDGNKIYYANQASETGGFLDYDNVEGFGPENIFYPEGSTLLSGEYTVKVHYYSDYFSTGPINWVVVVQNGSSINTHRGTLEQEDEVDVVTSFTK
ncbi:hypothetical protein RM545_00880 [Zunongwangia sp. F260]|uniref:DUF2135 domain-containing protein n=1 Tax=Autumnicola lenta TaxID=3075593 RepID=A0ABU3CFV2_9FLAO|nr:hypothetical protein [Zunongwangia sp. F260]MDT0645227.1 hypothetical protein [Zunongwangia sp. F260]